MKRNKHSLSHYRLLSADMGMLIPIGWFDVLPGDTIQHATSALVRAAPLVAPVMHPLQVRIHHWYVPYRLMWNEFEDFITGGPAGTSLPTPPTMTYSTAGAIGSIGDYLGVPTGVNNLAWSALPLRAYYKIWNEFYRDQDLETRQALGDTVTGGNTAFFGTNPPLTVSWEKDYFTSSRPWEQKGPAVTVPIGTTAPVVTTGVTPHGNSTADATDRVLQVGTGGNWPIGLGAGSGSPANFRFLDPTGLQANLAGASAVTVNVLRQALAIQRFEEARARYGSRYTEYLRYLGVRSSDGRLQRPEYLGGGKQTIQFSEVLQTAPSAVPDQANVVGALKGHGIGAMRSNRYRRFIEEHGLIMSLLSVRPSDIERSTRSRGIYRGDFF